MADYLCNLVDYGNYPFCHVNDSSNHLVSGAYPIYKSLDTFYALFCRFELVLRPSLRVYRPKAKSKAAHFLWALPKKQVPLLLGMEVPLDWTTIAC